MITERKLTRSDGVGLIERKSDTGFYIKDINTNIKYSSAIDLETATKTYIETDEPIEEIEGVDNVQ